MLKTNLGGDPLLRSLTLGNITSNMKGIILAGGTGSRLFPLTKITSKQLLPIYDRQMIFYPLETLKNSGIRDILVITDPKNAEQVKLLLGDGADMGLAITYCVQDKPRGLPEAFILGEDFIGSDNVTLILGDNIFNDTFVKEVSTFTKGARIFAKEVDDPERFGVVTFDENNKVTSLEEKPVVPKSNLAIPGFYIFDNRVVEFAKTLTPSKRGELEIVDLQKKYLALGELEAFKFTGDWVDAGTFDSLLEANIWAKHKKDLSAGTETKPKVAVLILIDGQTSEYIIDIIKTTNKDSAVAKYVLVDNATDFVGEVLEQTMRFGEKVVVIHKNVKISRAQLVTEGLTYIRDNVQCDYIFFLEEDTVPEEGSIKDFLVTLAKIPEKKVILTGHRANIPGATDIFYTTPKSTKNVFGTFFETVTLSKVVSFFQQLTGNAIFKRRSDFIYFQPVSSFTYAGTFLPTVILTEVGLPDSNIIKYGDDIEYSWRLKRAGYDIYVCYSPKIYDYSLLEKYSFSTANTFDESVTFSDVYLRAHNMVLISRKNTTQNKLSLLISILVWFFALIIYGIFHSPNVTIYFKKLKSTLSGIVNGYRG